MTQTTPNHTQTVSGWAHDASAVITPYTFKRRENGVNDVTIQILYCGICFTDLHYSRNDWDITMYPVVPGYVVLIPEGLPMDAVAPMLCGGITVYSPFVDNNLHNSGPKKIGVVGLGGLGHIAIKFGKAFGHHVTVISTSPSKEKEARDRLGADDFIISTNAEQMQSRMRTLDFILDTASVGHDLGPILELLKVKGTLALVGAPNKPWDLPSFPLIFGKRVIKGTIIGSTKETQEMMDFCGKHNITCEIEVIKPDQINEAFDRLAKNDVKYRFVIDIAGKDSSL